MYSKNSSGVAMISRMAGCDLFQSRTKFGLSISGMPKSPSEPNSGKASYGHLPSLLSFSNLSTSRPKLRFAQGLAMIPARVKVAATVIEEHFFAVRSNPAEQRRRLNHAIHDARGNRRSHCNTCS